MKITNEKQVHYMVEYYSPLYEDFRYSRFDDLANAVHYYNEKKDAKRKKLKFFVIRVDTETTEYTASDFKATYDKVTV